MKRIKEFLLNNTKVVIAFVLGVVISGTTVYAATYLYSSNQVSFDKSKVSQYGATKDDVQGAIDELYSIAKSEKCKDGYTKKSASDGYVCLKDIPTTNTITMGNDAEGRLSSDGKTMIISGSGTLNVIPSDYKNTLENIIIEDGIEEIPNSFCDGCSKLKNIYIAETVEIINGYNTFKNCSSLVSLTIASGYLFVNNSAVSMFEGCSSLKGIDAEIDIGSSQQLDDSSRMFYGCSSLTSLDLGNTDTSLIINMNHMFSGCSSLESLNLKYFTFPSDIYNIFDGDSSLTNLDISYLYFTDTTTFINQLSSLSNLSNIKLCDNTTIEQYANDHGISVTCDE